MGTLYLVATPIGNLGDISTRALETLRSVQLIAAEDTRHSRKLLDHYGIRTPLTSYHEHNKLVKLEAILAALAGGDVALISDAGTPALNDPGYELVKAALQAGCPVSPIPGPSAPLAALVASGLPTDNFLYLGYLPRKASERRGVLAEVKQHPYTLVFLETPQRLLEALSDLQAVLGDRQVAVARELTKLHEEIFRGSLSAAEAYFMAHAPRGEFTLVIGGQRLPAQVWDEIDLQRAMLERYQRGEPASLAVSELARSSGWPRRSIYRMYTRLDSEAAEET